MNAKKKEKENPSKGALSLFLVAVDTGNYRKVHFQPPSLPKQDLIYYLFILP